MIKRLQIPDVTGPFLKCFFLEQRTFIYMARVPFSSRKRLEIYHNQAKNNLIMKRVQYIQEHSYLVMVIRMDFLVIAEPGQFWGWASGHQGVEPDCVTFTHFCVIGLHFELRFQLRFEHATHVLWLICAGTGSIPG